MHPVICICKKPILSEPLKVNLVKRYSEFGCSTGSDGTITTDSGYYYEGERLILNGGADKDYGTSKAQ
jgi:hypothetical protein